MVIFLNADGSCEKVTPEHVYQGSDNVNEITVIAPFAQSTTLMIGFVLPNGLYWQSSDGSRYAPMDYVPQSINGNVGAWHYNLRRSVTKLMGDLYIAVNAITAQGNTTSYMCKVFIEESVLPNLPSAPEPDVYELILKYLGRVQGSLVASIEKLPGASNAIRYTDNFGVISAPIVIGDGEDPPIPVNAASTIKIPSTAWTALDNSYSYTLTAALHGQMIDGATPNDLWVSFDETETEAFKGAYEDYTVNAVGDITITVTSPVDMTVRVWNGKGLVDTQARKDIAAETDRAEAEEEKLQTQINELVNTGVDAVARADIAAETQRAETVEEDLQNQITTETTRAQSAEATLASDIQGLREDITNESHFRGMFDSVAALRAAYPTATPNDYAYIVGGNQWLYTNGAWTDSNVPSPNTAVPKGTATPLMDGTAQVGDSNTYADALHRHPSDTNKANTSGTYPNITAGNATKLSVSHTIDGVSFNGSDNVTHYGTSSTSASVATKTVSIAGAVLSVGMIITVKFTYANSISSEVTLNLNGFGAKTIKARETTTYIKWLAGDIIAFMYDGTYWQIIGGYKLMEHPVGSLYLSTTENTSPASRLGGSWTQITADAYLKVVTSNGGTLGGTSATHKIPASSLPAHTHTVKGNVISASLSGSSTEWSKTINGTTANGNYPRNYETVATGDGNAYHPYYYGIYCWVRTA